MSDTNREAICHFSGLGGSSLGAEMAGYRVLAGIDSNEFARATHKRNMPAAETNDFDYTSLTVFKKQTVGLARDLIRACGVEDPERWEGIHVFSAPCPGFSSSGKMDLNDPRNRLVLAMLPILAATPRSRLVFENVRTFLADKFKPIHDLLFDGLEKLDRGRLHAPFLKRYILHATNFDFAQKRRRLIFPVMQSGERYPEPPQPTCPVIKVLADVIGPNSGFLDLDPWHFPLTPMERRMVRHVPPGGNWLDAVKVDEFVREHAERHGWFDRPSAGRLKVLGWNEPASTVTASTEFTNSRVEPLHPDKRRFTIGENRALQGFPETWVILGDPAMRQRLTGNAVPPEMMRQAIQAYFG